MKMIYKYPSENKMHFNQDMDCYFDYMIVEADVEVSGYFATMQEAKEASEKKPSPKRKPRVSNELD